MKNIQYKVPRLKTVNIELRDFDYYIGKKFDAKKLDFDFDFMMSYKKLSNIEIFIHVQYAYLDKKTKKGETFFPVYHSDHIVNFELIKPAKNQKTFEVDYLAHLLGTAIIMIKGYYDNITRGYIINKHPLPVFNPTEMINLKYEDLIKKNLLTFSSK